MLPVALASQPTQTTTTTAPPATVTMHLLGPGETAAPQPSVALAPPATVAPPQTAVAGERWTVKPGECFWTIAESVLTRTHSRAPTDADIVPYWQRLISVNRSALAHPGDPDLIFPGQVFDVPTP
jgi:nucleoid-associated protein YgaU